MFEVSGAAVYVTAAYAVFATLLVLYLSILLSKRGRTRREIARLEAEAEAHAP